MGKLYDMVAFGDAIDDQPVNRKLVNLRLLRSSIRWMLAISLLGFAFSGVMTYREYAPADEVICRQGGSALGLPSCVFGLALYAALVGIAALALARTRGGVGDEIVDTSL